MNMWPCWQYIRKKITNALSRSSWRRRVAECAVDTPEHGGQVVFADPVRHQVHHHVVPGRVLAGRGHQTAVEAEEKHAGNERRAFVAVAEGMVHGDGVAQAGGAREHVRLLVEMPVLGRHERRLQLARVLDAPHPAHRNHPRMDALHILASGPHDVCYLSRSLRRASLCVVSSSWMI